MDYYQLYLYRIFMLGQMDIRLYSQEKQPLFDLTCPRKNTAAVQAEDKALDYFVSHLIQDYEKMKGNVLIATRYGFTFCGGKIELAFSGDRSVLPENQNRLYRPGTERPGTACF